MFFITLIALITVSVILISGIWPISTVYAHFATEGPEAPGFPHQCMQGGPGPDQLAGQCIQSKGGDDIITCNDNMHCHLYADSGSDTITGGNGRDYLHGDDMPHDPQGAGNDIINGQGGNDELHGDARDDTLTGGPGADHFNCGAGTDTVKDYNSIEGDNFFNQFECETIIPVTTGPVPPGPVPPPGTPIPPPTGTPPTGSGITPSCPAGYVFIPSLGQCFSTQ